MREIRTSGSMRGERSALRCRLLSYSTEPLFCLYGRDDECALGCQVSPIFIRPGDGPTGAVWGSHNYFRTRFPLFSATYINYKHSN
jgi:hypothetical protein